MKETEAAVTFAVEKSVWEGGAADADCLDHTRVPQLVHHLCHVPRVLLVSVLSSSHQLLGWK